MYVRSGMETITCLTEESHVDELYLRMAVSDRTHGRDLMCNLDGWISVLTSYRGPH